MTRRLAAKETRSERVERESVQQFGSVVTPSLQRSEVLAYVLVPGSGSRYRVLYADGRREELSRAKLLQATREALALAEIDSLLYERTYEATA